MKARPILLFSISLFFSLPVFAWNAGGHEVVAQIAFENLKPAVKEKITHILKARFHSKYDDGLFLLAATWPDRMKSRTKKYNAWHYIDLPIVKDGVNPPPLHQHNVVWAIPHSEQLVQEQDRSLKSRAKYLSFVIHFLGDIHQPLHCATLYSKKFPPPQGDLGGNKYLIQTAFANNLHAYWDGGLGLLINKRHGNYLRYQEVKKLANAWMAEYPRSYFEKQLQVDAPMDWAKASYLVAKNDAYAIAENSKPTSTYIANNQIIIRKQVVLAGYRLADILNQIFSAKN